jgi:hypothetical protein
VTIDFAEIPKHANLLAGAVVEVETSLRAH